MQIQAVKTFVICVTMLAAFAFPAAAEGAFRIPGSVVSAMRRTLSVSPAGPNSARVAQMTFTYDPASHSLTTARNGSKASSVTIQPPQQASYANGANIAIGAPVTFSGRVASAIIRGIAERKTPINPQLLERERRDDFFIIGYDHGTSVFFAELFPSHVRATPNPLALDTCIPNISYVIALPSYQIQQFAGNYCGQYG